MAAQQVAQHLAGHTRCSPRRDRARCNHACIGKTGFFSGGAPAFKYRDFMAINRQLVRGSDANDACAYDGDLHVDVELVKGLEQVKFMVPKSVLDIK